MRSSNSWSLRLAFTEQVSFIEKFYPPSLYLFISFLVSDDTKIITSSVKSFQASASFHWGCVCVCVCVCVYVCVCVNICMYICMYVYVCIFRLIFLFTWNFMWYSISKNCVGNSYNISPRSKHSPWITHSINWQWSTEIWLKEMNEQHHLFVYCISSMPFP